MANGSLCSVEMLLKAVKLPQLGSLQAEVSSLPMFWWANN